MVEHGCSKSLLKDLRRDQPDVVFNLASIYASDKANLVPGVLEIADIPYTGSGILGLSLSSNYTKLFPLLLKNKFHVPAFTIIQAGAHPALKLNFPLKLLRDGMRYEVSLNNVTELERTLVQFPQDEKITLIESPEGERVSLFVLDRAPFSATCVQPYLGIAQKAYDTLEARGLARFDFIRANEPLLERINVAPDPLDEKLLRAAAALGLDTNGVLQMLVRHAGRDRLAVAPDRQPIRS